MATLRDAAQDIMGRGSTRPERRGLEYMEEYRNLCMSCMQDKNGQEICPHCGYAEGTPNPMPALPVGTVLQGKYIVGKFLSSDGEGLTYSVFDCVEKCGATLREFYPTALAAREGAEGMVRPLNGREEVFRRYLHDFLVNARCVARMRDLSGIVAIYDIFEENGSAYYLTEDCEGCTLRAFIERNGGPASWNAVRPLFMPVLSTLSAMHDAGIFHYGISPDTLFVTKTGKMKLTGFRIAAVRMENSELPPSLIPGCAALEQYRPVGKCGSYTDVYAFAACLFFSLTARLPQDAPHRKVDSRLLIPTSILKQIPQHVTSAMANALQVSWERRTRTFERLRAELSVAPIVAIEQNKVPAVETSRRVPQEPEKIKKKRKPLPDFVVGLISGVIALFVFSMAGLAYLALTGSPSGDTASQTSSAGVSSVLVSSAAPETSSGTLSSGTASALPVDQIATPDFKNLTLEQAKRKSTLKIYVSESVFSDEVAEGMIISQSVEVGETIASNGIVTVVLSKGAQYRVLPAVEGLEVVQAKSDLLAAGFTIGTTETEPSTAVAAGTVIRFKNANLEAGKEYEYGTTVDLIVAADAG